MKDEVKHLQRICAFGQIHPHEQTAAGQDDPCTLREAGADSLRHHIPPTAIHIDHCFQMAVKIAILQVVVHLTLGNVVHLQVIPHFQIYQLGNALMIGNQPTYAESRSNGLGG